MSTFSVASKVGSISKEMTLSPASLNAAVEQYRDAGFYGPVYFMPVGGVESVYHLNNRTVADLAMKNGIRYSDRLQVPLFKNAWAT